MPEKEITNLNLDEGDQGSDSGASQDYIEAIQELKRNSVSKEKFDALQEEKNKLLKALIDGSQIEAPQEEDPVDIAELKKIIKNEDSTNLEYVEASLKLRQAIIDSGKQDPFLPYGTQVQITEADKQAAERVAQVFQECIDIADGDSEVFTRELMRRTVDAAPRAKKPF